MRSRDEARTDDAYEEDRYDERTRSTWLGRGWATAWGWPPVYRREPTGERAAREETTTTTESDGSWWDEGLIGLLLVVGVALFLFPEPATSMVGIALVLLGVGAWIVDWMT